MAGVVEAPRLADMIACAAPRVWTNGERTPGQEAQIFDVRLTAIMA